MNEGVPTHEAFDPKQEVVAIETLIDEASEHNDEFAGTTAIAARNILGALGKNKTREEMVADLTFRLKSPRDEASKDALEFILKEHFDVEIER